MFKKITVFFLLLTLLHAGFLQEYKEFINTTSLPTDQQTLSLQEALDLILKNNLKSEILKYEALKSDSDYQRYQTNFSPFLSFEAGSQTSYLDKDSLDATYSTHTRIEDASLGLGKKFKTGTTVVTGYRNKYTEFIKPTAFLTGKETTHQSPVFFIKIQQDLLKNSFGFNDRLQNDILKNLTASKRQIANYNIARLMVSGINDYWQLAGAQRNLMVANGELYAYRQIREAVKKNVELGMLENYNLNQFNALIASSEAKLTVNEYNYQKTLNKLLRTINFSEKPQSFELVSFDENIYTYDQKSLITAALNKRADYQEVLLNIDSLERQLKILKNQALPEAVLSWQAAGIGEDKDLLEANREMSSFDYSSWETRLSVKKILFDYDNKTKLRDAEYQLVQARLRQEELKAEIEDEVIDGIAAVNAAYTALQKSAEVLSESEKYFNALLRRLKQGRISTIEIKDAVDMMVRAYNYQTEALLNYNLALLNIDLITNTIFERYKININSIIEGQK